MTGIERLRKLSEDFIYCRLWYALISGTEEGWGCYRGDSRTVSDALLSIADQIEREREQESIALFDARMGEEIDICELFGIEPGDDPLTALRRHIEGQDDTIENLRIELGECDVSAAWVRDHGGLDYVKREWCSRVPYDLYQRRCQRLLGHIAECESALGRRNRRIEKLGHRVGDLTTENAELRKRAMPEGCEWPTVDGKPVVIGERMRSCGIDDCKVVGIDPANSMLTLASDDIEEGKATYFTDFAEHCHRPMPKVLDADGEPLEVGQTVWDEHGDELRVLDVYGNPVDEDFPDHTVRCRRAGAEEYESTMCIPSQLTHQRPVLDADGVPIKKGDEIYLTEEAKSLREVPTVKGEPLVVTNFGCDKRSPVYAIDQFDIENRRTVPWCLEPGWVTHTKPEVDTWQRIEEDAGCTATKYNERRGTIFTTKQQVARDLVRRCKALAERGQ